MKKLFYLALAAVMLSGCTAYKNAFRLSEIPQNKVKVTQTVVDVEPDFAKKITAESYKRMKSVTQAKENAYYKAITSNNIDVLVDPIYEIKSKRGLVKTNHSATVTGYAGYYKNPRSITVENQKNFDQQLDNFKKFISIDAVVKEQAKSDYMIFSNSGCCSGSSTGTTGAVTEKEINTTPDLVTRYNNFINQTTSADLIESKKEKKEDGKKKKLKLFK